MFGYFEHHNSCLAFVYHDMYHLGTIRLGGETMRGERVKAQRNKLNMTAEKLAEFMGTSRVTVQRWEGNVNEPDDETKLALASVLGVSVGYLMGETNDPSPQTLQQKQEVVSNVAPINLAHMIRIKVLPRDFKVCCGNGIDWGSEAIDFEETLVLPLVADRKSVV